MKQNKEKIAEFFKEKGIYLVLMVCVAAVGLAAAFVFVPRLQNEPGPTEDLSAVSGSGDERLDAAVTPVPTVAPTPTPIPDFTPAATLKPTATPKTKAAAPVEGEIIWGFAIKELIFSRTLEQWMTHSGVDIASPLGSEVHAVFSGTVGSVGEDSQLGVTVTVKHSNDMTTVYSNLKAEPPVKKGQKVDAGALLGYIGDTAVSERGDQSHLHFELHLKDEAVDPSTYVLFMKNP
ncbi:MAG: peptidoglycan DD-metalloendopeptidase family protein [Eubacteriales bacterium]|nr:peptidoglycan DD-metalloendopeptidase family protein [Eubacteriales bacterium]